MRTFLYILAFLMIPSLATLQDSQDDLDKKAKKHKKDVTTLRGLEFKTEVGVGVYSKEDLKGFLAKEMEREFPKKKAVKWEKTYKHFGLIPEELDLYQAILDLYGSSIAGFYHPETKELKLVKPGEEEDDGSDALMRQMFGVGMQEITLVHELCHAAQDQNFELSTLPLDTENNDDMIYAIKGVIEGDASQVGWKFALKDRFDQLMRQINGPYKSGMLPGKAGELPRYLRLTLTFPYGYGTEFVMDYCGDDPKAASKLFENLPTSTEQILHPEKYKGENPDWPTVITYKDILKSIGSEGEILVDNVHGEFVIQILLRELGAERSRGSKKAAAGWDGDRYFVIEEEGKVFSVWMTTWDSEEDAGEFFTSYSKGINKKYEKDEPSDAGETRNVWKLGDRRVLVERKGKDVLVMDNVTADVMAKSGDLYDIGTRSELSRVVRNKKGKFCCPKHRAYTTDEDGKCKYCSAKLVERAAEKKKDYR